MSGTEDEVPSWFGIFRGDMVGMENRMRGDVAGVESRITAGMDRMVTKDVYEAEQRTHAERHRIQDERLKEERLRAEAAEAKLAEQIEATERAQVAADAARKSSVRRLWFGITSGGATLAAVITAVEQWLHLNH
jgi:hypothetical protein